MSKKINIIVLGAEGMVGNFIYRYFKSKSNINVVGTSRNKVKELLFFDALNAEKNFGKFNSKFASIDFIINCIGILKNYNSIDELIKINSLFPHLLANYCRANDIKLINISTDAVFSDLAGMVYENTPTCPNDAYGSSKFLGEINMDNAINVRSSIIGFSNVKKTGLLEWIKNSDKNVEGFTNQKWSGCTTLQLANFLDQLFIDNNFEKLRRKTSVIHFAPIGPISKYKLVKEFSKILGKIEPKKANSKTKITRFLSTNHFDIIKIDNYTNEIKKSIENLIESEKII